MAYERDTRTEKKREGYVLVLNGKHAVYKEMISVRKRQDGAYELIDASDRTIGEAKSKSKVKLLPEYESLFKERYGTNLDVEIDGISIEEEKKEKESIKKENAEQLKQQELSAQEQAKQEEANKEEQNKDNELTKKENINSESTKIQKNADGEKIVMSKKELEQYPNADILDRKLARQLVSNVNKYDYFSMKVVEINGRPKVFVKLNDSDKYEVLPTYMDAKPEYGKVDSFEYGKERQDIAKGDVMTFKDRNGEIVRLDARLTKTGDIEVRKDLGDLDNDGDNESGLVETKTNKTLPTASKIEEEELDGEKKEQLKISSDEINEGPLSTANIKEILNEEDLTDDERDMIAREVAEKYPTTNPTKEELDVIIENCKEDKELDEPGVYYSHGVKMFRGQPME